MSSTAHRLLADLVLATHVGFVAFVIVGLLLVLAGGWRGWAWIRNPWFRAGHLAAIAIVVAQAWLGVICPLTNLELALREKAGDATYEGAFIAHWLQRVLYYEAPPWVFVTAYSMFGLAVAFAWWKYRPRPFHRAAPRR